VVTSFMGRRAIKSETGFEEATRNGENEGGSQKNVDDTPRNCGGSITGEDGLATHDGEPR